MATDIDVLSENDVPRIVDELVDVSTKSQLLGRWLRLPKVTVDGILRSSNDPMQHLVGVIDAFVKQVEPLPTWKVIVEALRRPVIGNPILARTIEWKYCTPTGHGPFVTTTPHSVSASKYSTCAEVKGKIDELQKKFEEIMCNTVRLFQNYFEVRSVVSELSTLCADEKDEHKMFPATNIYKFQRSEDNEHLFGHLSICLNYLSPQLLAYLINRFSQNHEYFSNVKEEMEIYESQLKEFRANTPLYLFHQIDDQSNHAEADIQGVIAVFQGNISDEMTLQDIEEFKLKYARHYKLFDFAFILNPTVGSGSFIVSFKVPESVVKVLGKNIPYNILEAYGIMLLKIAGKCVYSDASMRILKLLALSNSEKYFVEHPLGDFFCPVTTGLLLQPHLTSCCGKHLSQEAATRIQGEGGVCPLCNMSEWSTMLDKHFQRQVMELSVFCHHKDKGCDWKGELRDLDRHPCKYRSVPQAEQAEGEQQQIQEMRLRGVQAENRSHDQQIKRQLESKGETELQIKRARLEVRRKQTVLVYVQRELFMAKRNLRNMEEQLQSNYPEAMADLMTRVVANLDAPYGITFNSSGKMIVSEWGINRVSILDENRQKIESFRADQMKSPAGIAIDNEDHIYVSSLNMLRKFTSSGELIKEFGQRGGVKGKLESPRGLAIHDKDKQLYVCDRYVHRIQVFDLDLNFVRSIGSRGKGKGEFDAPFDVTFDTAGNMYVAEFGNKRIQVMDTSGQFIRTFAEEEDGLPTGLYIVKDKVYISDFSHDSLLVYTTSGEYLATLASQGQAVGELSSPYCITSYDDKLYVCDSGNNRIHIFDL